MNVHSPRPAIGRRRFVAGAGALSAALLAGCAGSVGDRRAADLGRADRLRMLNWEQYIDVAADGTGTVSEAAGALGMDISYIEGYDDNIGAWNDLFVPNLGAGRTIDYDIVVPTYWLAGRLVERNWLEPIPLEIVPNHVNIDPAYLTQPWDRGARFHMPWQAGLTGIAYNPTATGRRISSIDDLFDPAFRGRVGIMGELREVVPFGMLRNGHDPARPTEATATAALDDFLEADAAGQFGAVTFGDFADRLASGQLALAMAWSGDTVQLQQTHPEIEFVIPDEGGVRWFDTMIIPAGSPNVAAAGRWMNYVYDPENAAQITEFGNYISPVIGVREVLDSRGGTAAEVARNPILFPDDETARRLFTWGGLPLAVEDALDARFDPLIPTE